MTIDAIKTALKFAGKEVLLAGEEMKRPQEDVVALSACQSVRTAMKDLMRLYILAHQGSSNDKMSLQELLDLCKENNPKFSAVSVTEIECKGMGLDHRHCNGTYCLSTENVDYCVQAAEQIKGIIWRELNINH